LARKDLIKKIPFKFSLKNSLPKNCSRELLLLLPFFLLPEPLPFI